MARKIIARDVNNAFPENYDIGLWVDRHRLEGAEEAAGQVSVFDLFIIAEYNNTPCPAIPDVGWEIMDFDQDFFGAGLHKYYRSGVVVIPQGVPTPGTSWRQITVEGFTRKTNTPIPRIEFAEADFPTDASRVVELIERASAEYGLPGAWDVFSQISGPFITYEADSTTPYSGKTVYEILEEIRTDPGQPTDAGYPVPERFWYISGEWVSPGSPMTSGILRVLHYYSGSQVAREPVPLTDRADGKAHYLFDTFSGSAGNLNGKNAETGQAWAALVGTWERDGSGRARLLTNAGENALIANAFVADCEFKVDFAALGTGQRQLYRVSSHPSEAYKWQGFALENTGSAYALKKYQAGSWSTIGTFAITPAIGTMTVLLKGQSHTIYVNGVPVVQTDQPFNQTATLYGIGATAVNAARFDNVEVWAKGAHYFSLVWPKDASGLTNIMAIQGPGYDPAPVAWDQPEGAVGGNDGDLTKTLRPEPWQADHTYLTDDVITSTTLDGGHYFLDGAGGKSGETEPTWDTDEEATTGDNGLTWRRRTWDAGGISAQEITDDGGEVTAYIEQVPKTSDDFNRPDNTATMSTTPDGKEWEVFGTNVVAGIRNGRAYFAAGTGPLYAVADHEVATAIIEAPFTLGGVGQRMTFRFRDANNLWYVERQAASYKIYKRVNGSDTLMGTYSVTPVNEDLMKVSCEDNVIKLYRNGTGPHLTITDKFNMGATKHGIGTNGLLTVEFDAFKVWQTYAKLAFGMGTATTVKRPQDIDFGWVTDAAARTARPHEAGTPVGTAGSFALSDSLSVLVRPVMLDNVLVNEVRYFHNDVLAYISAQHPTVTEADPFHVQGAIFHDGATISNTTLQRFTYGIYDEPASVAEFGPWPAPKALVREDLDTEAKRRAYKDSFFSRHAWPVSPIQTDTFHEYTEGRLVLFNNRKFGWVNKLILIVSMQPDWSDDLNRSFNKLTLGHALREWGDEDPAGFMLKNLLNDRAVPPKPTGMSSMQGQRDGPATVNHKFFWNRPRQNERWVDIELQPVGGQAWQPRRFPASPGQCVAEELPASLAMVARFRAVSWSGVVSHWTTALPFTTAELTSLPAPTVASYSTGMDSSGRWFQLVINPVSGAERYSYQYKESEQGPQREIPGSPTVSTRITLYGQPFSSTRWLIASAIDRFGDHGDAVEQAISRRADGAGGRAERVVREEPRRVSPLPIPRTGKTRAAGGGLANRTAGISSIGFHSMALYTPGGGAATWAVVNARSSLSHTKMAR